MRKHAAILTLAVALLAPGAASAEADAAFYGAAVFDVVILRPLGFAASLVGAALFIPAALVTAPNGLDSIEQVWEQFVITPAEHVYTRPLGDW